MSNVQISINSTECLLLRDIVLLHNLSGTTTCLDKMKTTPFVIDSFINATVLYDYWENYGEKGFNSL